MNTKLFKNYCQ